MKLLAAIAVLFSIVVSASPVLAQETEIEPGALGSSALREDLRVAGHRNGRLPEGVLERVPAGANERCNLEAEAAAAWELLLQAAARDGMTGFAAGWCYRSVKQQERTYARNCGWVQDPAPPAPAPPPVVEGEEPPPPPPPPPAPPKRWVCDPPTAKPGTSNHGWGRAIDVVDTTTRKAHVLSCRDPQFAWLVEHAPRYGWVLPRWAQCGRSSEEPWHWEWSGLNVTISELIIVERAARGAEIPQ